MFQHIFGLTRKSSVKFRTLCLIGFLGVLMAVVAIWHYSKAQKPICKNCNVIIVSLDTLSALHLPCYGYSRNTAPILCEYGAKNVFFENAISQAPMTLQSHFSIFTSLYTHNHKMDNDGGFTTLDEKHLTLAQIFRMNGYKTIYNGPLTDGHLPLNRGIERGFDLIEARQNKLDIDDWDISLNRLLENAKNSKPTFMFLHTYMVHDPYLPGRKPHRLYTDSPDYPNISLTSEEYHALSIPFFSYCSKVTLRKSTLGWKYTESVLEKMRLLGNSLNDLSQASKIFDSFSENAQINCFRDWYVHNINFSDPKQRIYLEALYDEQINNMDKKLSKLFKLLNNKLLAKNTILVITADHGEEFWEHGQWGHANNIYSTSVQVPLIIHYPGAVPKKISQIVESIDIYPTMLALTGLRSRSGIEGMDLTNLIWDNPKGETRDYALSEWRNESAIQEGKWRFYHKNETAKNELYDTSTNPLEKVNEIDKYPEIAARLGKILESFYK